jgi:hypothetical protein
MFNIIDYIKDFVVNDRARGLVVESTLRMWPESVVFLKSLMSTSGNRNFISSSTGARSFQVLASNEDPTFCAR